MHDMKIRLENVLVFEVVDTDKPQGFFLPSLPTALFQDIKIDILKI